MPASFLDIAYRYFLAVAETGSVREAARRLNVAPSAISRQLKLLESELATAVLDRDGRNISLSPAGEILLQGLRASRHSLENIIERLDALNGLRQGHLRIASVESVSVSLLPELLQTYATTYPGITFSVSVAGSETVTEMVHDHRAEVGFTFNPKQLRNLEVVTGAALKVCAVMSPDHALAKAKTLTLGQCMEHAVAWPSNDISLRAILEHTLRRRTKMPHGARVMECNSLRLMATMARLNQCIAFQPPIGIETDLRQGTLVAIPLTDKGLARDEFAVIKRRGLRNRPAVDAFLDIMTAQLPKMNAVLKK
nr:LysR family transcriptional regulator [Aestuariivirga litoralis]